MRSFNKSSVLKSKAIGVGLLAFLVSGCGPLISFGSDSGPGETYGLRYPASHSQAEPNGPIIYVDSPQMVEGLDGHGVTVIMGNGRRTVLEDASWSTHLSDMLRDYVAHSLSSQSGANMISEGGLDIKAGCRLGVKVWSFEFVPGASSDEDTVNIALQFSLVRISDSELISHPTFSKTVHVNSGSIAGVMGGFSTAMEQAADDYGSWLRERMGQCAE